MLDQAFEALKTYDWGQDAKALQPIEDAVVTTHGDAAKRKELEDRLVAALGSELTLDGKQYVCRQLSVIGTAAAIPALTALLTDKQLAHMGRVALERIPAAEAATALRESLAKVSGEQKAGVLSSLGARQDVASVPAIAQLLSDGDAVVAGAAAKALGAIRSSEAAQALSAAKSAGPVHPAICDASFACAESLLAAGKNLDALAIYKGLLTGEPSKHVKLAATRGMLACTGKK